jgi:CheY-like chemotaxis protein
MVFEYPLPTVRALVVDDHIDSARSLSYLLQLLGCRTAVAFGGEMGLRVARLFEPTLVFVDLHMPGLDGCQVLSAARQLDGPAADALYVGISDGSLPEDELRCLRAGFHRFAHKPLAPGVIHGLLKEARRRASSVPADHSWQAKGLLDPPAADDSPRTAAR